ncbi:MAG: molybdopterin synthase catalytic subunit MoaE [Plesiomonas sp.]
MQVQETRIRVSEADFDITAEHVWLSQDDRCGAVVTFTGKVRDHSQQGRVSSLHLEHYPAMTDKALHDIVREARARWSLGRVSLIHRVGELNSGEQIVYVGVSSGHRQAAFAAAEFIMDYLKVRAPFWKKEQMPDGARWVEAKTSDQEAAQRWQCE